MTDLDLQIVDYLVGQPARTAPQSDIRRHLKKAGIHKAVQRLEKSGYLRREGFTAKGSPYLHLTVTPP